MDLTGEPDGPPTKSGLSLVDYSGGFVAAISLLAGLHAARRDGVGMDCDVSLYDTAMGMLTYPATWHLNAGFTPVRTRHSAHPSLVPFQAFEASDGWLVVGCAKEKFWARLAEVVGHPEWAQPGLAVRHVRRPAAQQRGAAGAAGGDLPEAHSRRVAGGALPGRDPLRTDQRRAGGAARGAHPGPQPDRRDRAPALRHRHPGRLPGAGRQRDRRRTGGRRCATRTSTWWCATSSASTTNGSAS